MKLQKLISLLLTTMLISVLLISPAKAESLSRPLSASGDFVWTKGLGGTADDQGYSIVTDSSGNIYTTGFFSGSVDFDSGNGVFEMVSSNLSQDIFICKFDNNGSLVWATQIGQAGNDVGYDIAIDTSGNVYVTGTFSGSSGNNAVDFDPDAGTFFLNNSGASDIFVVKLDGNGNFVWAKNMGGINIDVSFGIAIDSNGNVYTTGYFSDTADFDPGINTFNLISAGMADIFISKLDSTGNFVWAKRIGGTGINGDKSRDIALDSNGNVYTTGYFENSVDFDPGVGVFNLANGGTFDIFISKLDNDGGFLWAKSMGGTNVETGQAITLDSAGNVYTTGDFNGNADFDPGPDTASLNTAGVLDIYVSKLNSNGEFVWARSMGGSTSEGGRGIAIDSLGNVYTTGTFMSGTVDFDPGPGSYILTNTFGTSYNIFISKLNSDGNFVWAKSMGSTTNNSGSDITLDNNGSVYTTGTFSGTVDFDPGAGTNNITSAGAFDIYISKLNGESIISGPTTVDATIAGTSMGNYPMVPETSQVLKYLVDGGPVVIGSDNGVPIIASLNQWRRNAAQPETWFTGVAQSMALPVEQITNRYVMPRYNGTNPTLYDAVLMANVDTVPRTLTVTIGGTVMGTYPLNPSQSVYATYPIVGGPIVVSSVTGARIVASLYELKRSQAGVPWNGQSEMMGLPSGQLSDKYLLPIYFGAANPATLDARLYFANVDTVATTVEVKIAGVSRGTYLMQPSTSMEVKYLVDGGPVEISSNNGAKIVASLNQWRRNAAEPVEWFTGVAQSMALPVELITDKYVIPRYNGTDPTLYDAVLMANVDSVPRTITVKIGATVMGTYPLNPSASVYATYPIADGPIIVSSDVGAKIVASLYELKRYQAGVPWNGQSEMMGLPFGQLSDQYLLPIYFGAANPATLDARLYIAVP